MDDWLTITSLSCLPPLVATLSLRDGELALRALLLGAIADRYMSFILEGHGAFVLGACLAGYLIYVAGTTTNRLTFGQLDLRAILVSAGAEFSLLVLILVVTSKGRPIGLGRYCFLTMCASLTLLLGCIDIALLFFQQSTGILLAVLIPLCRVSFELLLRSEFERYDTEAPLFAQGFGVVVSDTLGKRGSAMVHRTSYAESVRKRYSYVVGALYICVSYALPISFALLIDRRRPILDSIACMAIATMMLGGTGVILFLIRKRYALRDFSLAMFKPGYVYKPERTVRSLPQASNNADGKQKLLIVTTLRGELRVGGYLFFSRPTAVTLWWFLGLSAVMITTNLWVLGASYGLFTLAQTLLFAYISARAFLAGELSMTFYVTLMSGILTPLSPINTAIFLLLQFCSFKSEGRPAASELLLAMEFLALGMLAPIRVFFWPYIVLHIIFGVLASITVLRSVLLSIVSRYGVEGEKQRLQNRHVARQAYLHVILLMLVTTFSISSSSAILRALCLSVGIYAYTGAIAQSAPRGIAMKLRILTCFRLIFLFLGALASRGRLGSVGYRIRGSYLLNSLVISIILFVSMCFEVSSSRVGQGILLFLACGGSALIIWAGNLLPLISSAIIYVSDAHSMSDISSTLLVVYRAFHTRLPLLTVSSPVAFRTLRILISVLIQVLIWSAGILSILWVTKKQGPTMTRVFSVTTASFVGLYLLTPGLLYPLGESAEVGLMEQAVTLFIVVIIIAIPYASSLNGLMALAIGGVSGIVAMIIALSVTYPILVLYLVYILGLLLLPAFILTPVYLLVCGSSFFIRAVRAVIPQSYLLASWFVSTTVYGIRLRGCRELYLRALVGAFSDPEASTWKLKTAQGFTDVGVTNPGTLVASWFGGVRWGYRILRYNVGAYVVLASLTLAAWNYDAATILYLLMGTSMVPWVETTDEPAWRPMGGIKAVAGYLGTGGFTSSSTEAMRTSFSAFVCNVLWLAVVCRCAYGVLRAPTALAGQEARLYAPYIVYDVVSLGVISLLTIVPYAALTGRPRSVFIWLSGVQKKRLLVSIAVLICLLSVITTEKALALLLLISLAALVSETPSYTMEQKGGNSSLLGGHKTVLRLEKPASMTGA
ncbi:hypothetical protein GMRT_11000 [Giardia muris]|uniref:Uncharacterized protein n=1 Tax=Giardia muris TaxID=5742 RepID=A0A4Z1T5J0_GIAMU|nr:hypothetical protein GMRT_11000 [Giardia muris]|eukprot:TNJ29313.1 hypothetical protein GMRT_11000 [Giardia muris]